MKYLMIDAEQDSTGIRDYYEGEYLSPEDLHLSPTTTKWIAEWLLRYENQRRKSYVDNQVIEELDREGKEIALTVKRELLDVKIGYYSDARMTQDLIL
jgi:hypothetical protein